MATLLLLWMGLRVAMTMPLDSGAFSADANAFPARWSLAAVAAPVVTGHSDVYHGRIAHIVQPPSRRLDGVPIVRTTFADAQPAPLEPSPGTLAGAAALPLSASPSLAAVAPDGDKRLSVAPASIIPHVRSAPEKRWSGSAWLFWRQHKESRFLGSTGQLGGAQAGLRVDRRLTGGKSGSLPLSAYARLTTALHEPAMPEAAIGVAITPLSGRVPLSIALERRIAFDKDGRNAFALVTAGGLNPTMFARLLIAEGYMQAGLVGLSRRDAFVDGRLSLGVPLDRRWESRAGLSVSGGAQPGLSRVDIGPAIETRLPLGAIKPRLAVEWRQRVAGHARPDSGLAVTLATDF